MVTSLHFRSIEKLEACNGELDKLIPKNRLQDCLDSYGQSIESFLEPLKLLNEYLHDNGDDERYKQVCRFVAKLPFKHAADLSHLTYQTIRELAVDVVHPMKVPAKLGMLISDILSELSQPVTWTKIGAGLLGFVLCQSFITSFMFFDMVNGTVLEIAKLYLLANAIPAVGVSIGALGAAIEAKSGERLKEAKEEILFQLKESIEPMIKGSFLSTWLSGLEWVFAVGF